MVNLGYIGLNLLYNSVSFYFLKRDYQKIENCTRGSHYIFVGRRWASAACSVSVSALENWGGVWGQEEPWDLPEFPCQVNGGAGLKFRFIGNSPSASFLPLHRSWCHWVPAQERDCPKH